MLLSPMLTDETITILAGIAVACFWIIVLALVITLVIWFIRNKKNKDK